MQKVKSMEKKLLRVLSNEGSGCYFTMKLATDENLDIKPGQFLNLQIKEKSLRRPISISDYKDGVITLAIKINGEGTKILSEMPVGEEIDTLLPLGNGIDLDLFKDEILLVGGGIGVAPLLYIAREAKNKGLKVTTVLGFGNRDNTILLDEIKAYSDNFFVSYDCDGLNVVDVLKKEGLDNIKYFACGPLVMLKGVTSYCNEGYCSLEARMGCGFGACMGCSATFKSGRKRICKEGPVFEAEDIIWENLM